MWIRGDLATLALPDLQQRLEEWLEGCPDGRATCWGSLGGQLKPLGGCKYTVEGYFEFASEAQGWTVASVCVCLFAIRLMGLEDRVCFCDSQAI